MCMRTGRLCIQRGLQVRLIRQSAVDRAPCRRCANCRPRPVATQKLCVVRRAGGRQCGNANLACEVKRHVPRRTGQRQYIRCEVPACAGNRLSVCRCISRARAIGKPRDLVAAPANVAGWAVLAALVDTVIDAIGKVFVVRVVARGHDLHRCPEVTLPNGSACIGAVCTSETSTSPRHQNTPALRY